ncbi:MAG: BlaI/MecI/CopY family transcriptional regulator [Hyphomonadaceae bacterium]|nr:BlaI/MecI/CopY family transcriptional regulator [Hyphomonadaceae bacterium]
MAAGISESEARVMEALWRDSPLSAEQVIAEVAKAQGWTEATVKTLLNRLLRKKAITAKRDGRRYLYRPRLKRPDYVAAESRDLLDRLFGGKLAPLIAHFSERQEISEDEIAELKKLIRGLDDGR